MCIMWLLLSDNLIKMVIVFSLNPTDYSLYSTLTFLLEAPYSFQNAHPPPLLEPNIQHQSDFLSVCTFSEAALTLGLVPNLETGDRVPAFS